MAVLIILIAVFLMLLLQRKIYQRFWNWHLAAGISFSEKEITEGEAVVIEEELTNDKILPLPWVHLKFQVKANGQTAFFESELFHILFHQRIRLKRERMVSKRGIYQISDVDLISYDLFLTTKLIDRIPVGARLIVYPSMVSAEEIQVPFENLMGDVITRRFSQEDPYQFKGIREYQPDDEFKRINFLSSAKSGQWLVNTFEYTLQPRVLLILLCDRTANLSNESEYERALHLAGTLTSMIENQGIPAAMISNGIAESMAEEIHLDYGCSLDHTRSVLERLAGLDTSNVSISCLEMLEKIESEIGQNDFIVLLTPYRRDDLILKYQEMQERNSVYWISSLSDNRLFDEEEVPRLDEKLENFTYDRF